MMRTRGPVAGMLTALAAACLLAAAPAGTRDNGTPIAIKTTRVPLNPQDLTQSRVGAFAYAGGLELTSVQTDRLHGLSDLAVTGSDRLTAVGDEGVIVTARILLDAHGRLSDVRDGRLTILVGKDGNPLPSKEEADSEGLALMANGDRLVSFERDHRIWLYPAGGGVPRDVPKPDVTFPNPNGGMEALAPDPDRGRDAYIVGAELTGETWTCRISTMCVAAPTIARPPGLSLVALRRLRGGRTAALLRGFSPDTGSRIVLHVLRANAVEAELELSRPVTVDNFEGVAAVGRPNGITRFYLISDDNASPQQRTLLLAFDWRAN